MLKIGALSFVNSLPFFFPFIEKKIPHSDCFIFDHPSKINALLHNGSVDIALVSSKSFLDNREAYILLTNFGIATTKKSMSVCLFLKGSIRDLDKRKVLIPDSSATSVALLKVLCNNFWNVEPQFIVGSFATIEQAYADPDIEAFLVIGDDCFKVHQTRKFCAIDLAGAWHEYTKKSFVFAMFATRMDAWLKREKEILEFHNRLTAAFEYSLQHYDDLISFAVNNSNLSKDLLHSYYRTLEFQLDPRHFHGLELFVTLSKKNLLQNEIRQN